jgi:transposase
MSSQKIKPITIPPELEAEMTPAVRAFVGILLDRIAKLEARVEELERGRKTPQNSSLPPSSQHPHSRPQPQRRKSKRKRGGQPGHEKHERPLIPSKQCDEVQSLKPTECRRCGAKLAGSDPEPLRHQVWELPEIKPIVSEYQRHRLCCPHCGEMTCAELPAGVPCGQSGPRLIAFATILMAYFRQSKRRTAMFLGSLLNQPCCPSLVVKMQTLATAAVRPSYQELAAELPKQDRLGGDESPTKEGKAKAWLWTLVAPKFTVFAMRRTREATVLEELLTDQFSGVVTCDRAKMYWRLGRLQWCWAHLIRDFQAMIDRGNAQAKRLGYDLRRAAKTLFRHWTDYRNAAISWAAVQRRLAPVRREVERLLRRGLASGNRQVQGTCRELHEHREWLWTFARCCGVEPTNNASERALRHAVIWRKLSFGVQSVGGSRFVETMLTVIETCRQQGRHLLSFLTAAVQSHLARHPAPSLLPVA